MLIPPGFSGVFAFNVETYDNLKGDTTMADLIRRSSLGRPDVVGLASLTSKAVMMIRNKASGAIAIAIIITGCSSAHSTPSEVCL